MSDITVAPDGFLWYRGAKLQIRLVPEGLQFKEKDKFRAAKIGGDLFIIPLEQLLEFISIDLLKQSYTNEGASHE